MSIAKTGTEFDLGDICRAINAEYGLPYATVRSCIEKFAAILPVAIAEHGRVEIPGLGVFRLKRKAAIKGRNFDTGEAVEIPEGLKVAFKASDDAREAITGMTGKPTY
jgi:DNA-binding protein HU-beta